jgi:hypothetical protein
MRITPIPETLEIAVGDEIVEISAETKAQSKFKNDLSLGPIPLSNLDIKTIELADSIVKNGNYGAITVDNVVFLKEFSVIMGLTKLQGECNKFLQEFSLLSLSPKVLKCSYLYLKILSQLPPLSRDTAMEISHIFQTNGVGCIDDNNLEKLKEAAKVLEIPKLARFCDDYIKEREVLTEWENSFNNSEQAKQIHINQRDKKG